MTVLAATAANTAHGAFEDVGTGARAPGMGNAFTAVADDAYAVYYNPAGLALLERPQIAAAYSRLHLGLSDGSELGLSQFTYGGPLRQGRWGGLGFGWNRLSLSGLYTEQTLHLAWGQRVYQRPGRRLLVGGAAKFLSHSFEPVPEASNAMDKSVATGTPDPLLSGSRSRTAIDMDFGLIYQFAKNLSAGLSARHLLRPDVSFGGGDKLPLNLRGGLAYRALWLNLAGELHLDRSASGAMDRDIVLAAERFFPSLDRGTFGLRGALAVGARDFRQISTGLSYRISKVGFDYAFLMPLGTVKGTIGTHRMSMTFHFGGPTPEEELQASVLDQLQRLRESGRGVDVYEIETSVRPRDLDDPALAEVRRLVEAGQYRKALGMLADLARQTPSDKGLQRLHRRLDVAAGFFPELPSPEKAWEKMTAWSVMSILQGQDSRAVLQASYALSLRPEDVRLDRYLARLEETTQVKGLRLPPDSPRNMIEELFYRSEIAFSKGDYGRVLDLANDVLVLDPENPTALSRAGSIYYLLKQYEKAEASWRQALARETNPKERAALEHHLKSVRSRLGLSELSAAPADAAAPQADAPALAPVDSKAVEGLYQKGVEHFARGEHLQAASAFLKILQIDPDNAQAQKALERIKRHYPRAVP